MSTSDQFGEDFEGRNALVAEYVLGLLSTSEHERVGRLIENDQDLRAERDFWVSRFAALNAEYEETPVPRHLYAAIEARAFGDVVRNRPLAGFWENLMVWRAIAAGAMAVAVVAVGANLIRPLSGEAVPDKDFELWAIQGGNNPISMGIIPVNERSAVSIAPEVMQGWGEGSVLAITLEQKGGSPDGNPHGPIVAKGAVTKI